MLKQDPPFTFCRWLDVKSPKSQQNREMYTNDSKNSQTWPLSFRFKCILSAYWLVIFVINILIISTWKWHWRPFSCAVEEMAWNFGTPWTKSSCFHRTFRFFGTIRFHRPATHLISMHALLQDLKNKLFTTHWYIMINMFPKNHCVLQDHYDMYK